VVAAAVEAIPNDAAGAAGAVLGAAGGVPGAILGGVSGAILGAAPIAAPAAGTGPSAAAEEAVAWALARLGTPYRWGGTGPGGFDCSGLVQAAYAASGIALPRVAQAQYDAGPHLAADETLEPGDLVFFGSSPTAVDHVGMALGDGTMVDAPHTGAVVRVEPIWATGYVGATRPAG
jgi:cell wall-associated NlpC family hydrolase